MELFDDNFFDNDDEITAYLNDVVSTVESQDVKAVFNMHTVWRRYANQNKVVCQDVNCMHNKKEGETFSKKPTKPIVDPETRLHPATYRKFVTDAALKLANDECYSESTRLFFQDFNWTHEEALVSYAEIRELDKGFKGNGEKFYPSFYELMCTKIFTYLSGYVFNTMYKRLFVDRPIKHTDKMEVKENYLALLLAGKSSS